MRAARRKSMLGLYVSGSKKKCIVSIGPANQSISQVDQRQFVFGTENPEMSGPIAGPTVVAKPQMEIT